MKNALVIKVPDLYFSLFIDNIIGDICHKKVAVKDNKVYYNIGSYETMIFDDYSVDYSAITDSETKKVLNNIWQKQMKSIFKERYITEDELNR